MRGLLSHVRIPSKSFFVQSDLQNGWHLVAVYFLKLISSPVTRKWWRAALFRCMMVLQSCERLVLFISKVCRLLRWEKTNLFSQHQETRNRNVTSLTQGPIEASISTKDRFSGSFPASKKQRYKACVYISWNIPYFQVESGAKHQRENVKQNHKETVVAYI